LLHEGLDEGSSSNVTGFILHLQAPTAAQRIDGVTSLVARDASGSFGILPGHARTITLVEAGLLRFRRGIDAWEYAACSGGLLYVQAEAVHVCTGRFLLDTDYGRISTALETLFKTEAESIKVQRSSVARMEEEMLRRLWKLAHG
jgi:F-type H+-transporting ATPase subunit epsilon